MTAFAPAVREQSKARIALTGISGSGKTWTALTLAHALGDQIAVVDTTRTAREYAGVNDWAFNVLEPYRFSPVSLAGSLAEAAGEGHDVVIVDTLTHYWSGFEGQLEQVDKHPRGGWNEERPNERMMAESLASYPGHVIVTLRSKTEHVTDRDEAGHPVARRLGLKPEQRDGIEYDFNLVADLDMGHNLTVTSTRVPALDRAVLDAASVVQPLIEWCAGGEAVKDAREIRDLAIAATTLDQLVTLGQEMDHLHLRNVIVLTGAGAQMKLTDLMTIRFQQVKAELAKAPQ